MGIRTVFESEDTKSTYENRVKHNPAQTIIEALLETVGIIPQEALLLGESIPSTYPETMIFPIFSGKVHPLESYMNWTVKISLRSEKHSNWHIL